MSDTTFELTGLPEPLQEFAQVAFTAAFAGAGVLGERAAADAAGETTQITLHNKSSGSDWVTDFDRRAEDAIRDAISAARPQDAITGEEYGSTTPENPSGYRWCIDPLDGTTNFIRNIPQYGTSVALADQQNRWLVGIVAAPALNKTWFAVADGGAWLLPDCPSPEAVSTQETLSATLRRARQIAYDPAPANAALIATGFAYNSVRRNFQYRALRALLDQGADLRRIGSAALDLCMVADGTLDGYAEFGTCEWDWAAGMLIAEQAGAPVRRQTEINNSWSAAGAIDLENLPDPNTPVIRPATGDDFEVVGELTVNAYIEGGYLDADHPYAEILRNAADRARRGTVFVAELDGQVAGAVMITYPGQPYTEVALERELEVRMLAVDPKMQGRGLARALMNYILDIGRRDPEVDRIILTSNQAMLAAHKLYASLGFVRVPERDWGIEDHTFWVFTRSLAAH